MRAPNQRGSCEKRTGGVRHFPIFHEPQLADRERSLSMKPPQSTAALKIIS